MKKTLLVVLALVMILTLAVGSFSTVSATAFPATSPQPPYAYNNGAYVILHGIPVSGNFKFDYGWIGFRSNAVGYWLGLYDVTNSHYVWSGENPLKPAGSPGNVVSNSLTLCYSSTETLPSGQYKIVFFVRSSYSPGITNVAVIDGVQFTIP